MSDIDMVRNEKFNEGQERNRGALIILHTLCTTVGKVTSIRGIVEL